MPEARRGEGGQVAQPSGGAVAIVPAFEAGPKPPLMRSVRCGLATALPARQADSFTDGYRCLLAVCRDLGNLRATSTAALDLSHVCPALQGSSGGPVSMVELAAVATVRFSGVA